MPAWNLIFTRQRANGTQISVFHRCVLCYDYTANHQDTVKFDRERSTLNLPGKKKRNVREVLCSGVALTLKLRDSFQNVSALGLQKLKFY